MVLQHSCQPIARQTVAAVCEETAREMHRYLSRPGSAVPESSADDFGLRDSPPTSQAAEK